MKSILIPLLAMLAPAMAFTQTSRQALDEMMEKEAVKAAVTNIFVATDKRDWLGVRHAFANRVLLDYRSMPGGAADTLSPPQITDRWKSILPGFDQTHHALSNFQVSVAGGQATVLHYGNAEHFMERTGEHPLWVVVGTYRHHLSKQDGRWVVDQMAFYLKYMTGNLGLARYAQEKTQNQSTGKRK